MVSFKMDKTADTKKATYGSYPLRSRSKSYNSQP